MLRLIARSAGALLVAFAAFSAPLAAQVAPTLPSDTLQGRKLPPEANVPRQVIAPTLPSDTLQGRKLPPEANVPRQVIAPTLPTDTLEAAKPLCTEPLGRRAVATTPRPPASPGDTVAADTTSAPCRVPPAKADSVATPEEDTR